MSVRTEGQSAMEQNTKHKEVEEKKELLEKLQKKTEVKENLPVMNKKQGSEMFLEFMERHKQDFAMVVPKHLSPERVMRVAIAACKRTPELMTCWLPSVVGGCLEASALGLEINTPLQQCFLIPFKNNKTQRTEAQLIIGFQGYIELMYNNPKVLSVYAAVVYENDVFICEYGTEEKMIHRPLEMGDPGLVRGFYAYAKMIEKAYRFVYMPKAEVDRIRNEYSSSYKSNPKDSPWTTEYLAMGCKTAIRKLQKFVPKSAEVGRAVEADFKVINAFEASVFQGEASVNEENTGGKSTNRAEEV